LPGGIFNKGFVRSYARFLGIDEAQAVNDYMQSSGTGNQPPVAEDTELKAIAERKEKERERQRAHSKGVPWGLTAAVLLLICLSLAVWGFYSRERREPAATRPVSAKSVGPTNSAAEPSAPTRGQATLTEVSQSSATPQATSSAAVVPQSEASEAPLFNVQVQANEDSWLTVTSDGKSVYADTLAAPTTKSFGAQKELVIHAGNAGGLELSFNDHKLAAIGSEGEVKTVTFTATGLQASSPKSTE
jgi:cytoskeletal protein RodZ